MISAAQMFVIGFWQEQVRYASAVLQFLCDNIANLPTYAQAIEWQLQFLCLN